MTKFEIGRTYTMKSPCNQDCVWTYEVIKRTAKTITITNGKSEIRCRISKSSEMLGTETVYPLGQYSMAPTLRA